MALVRSVTGVGLLLRDSPHGEGAQTSFQTSQGNMATKKAASNKKPGPQCKCIDLVNKGLQKGCPWVMIDCAISIKMGAVLTIPLTLKAGAPKGTKAPLMVVTYCPFCGKKYVQE